MSTSYMRKLYPNSLSLISIEHFATPGTICPIVREVTCIKTFIILESNWDCAKGQLDMVVR